LWVEIWLLVTLFLWCFVVSRLGEAFMSGLLASWFYDVVGGGVGRVYRVFGYSRMRDDVV